MRETVLRSSGTPVTLQNDCSVPRDSPEINMKSQNSNSNALIADKIWNQVFCRIYTENIKNTLSLNEVEE